jgi:hypothetical protein
VPIEETWGTVLELVEAGKVAPDERAAIASAV